MIQYDLWYGDKVADITKIDIVWNDLDLVYRGNMYIDNKMVGDYTAQDTASIEKFFSHLTFKWD